MGVRFEHESHRQRIRFGSGAAAEAVAAEVDLLGASRVMLIASGSARAAATRLGSGLPVVHRHDGAAMHVPIEVAERARTAAADSGADVIVCVGGGSATGLAKAVALTTGLPIVAVPTTYAGSEATTVYGITEAHAKTTGSTSQVLPAAIVYDATLSSTLPVPLSVASGLNALAHCVDSMWAPRSDPINRALAAEAIAVIAQGLPAMVDDPDGLDPRERMLYGAYLAGTAFSSAGSGLHHKICHVLGGRYDMPHAQTHAVVLPYVLAYNEPSAPDAAARIATAFGTPTATEGLQRLRDRIKAPHALRDLGLDRSAIPDAAAAILPVVPADNPTTPTLPNLTRLLEAAWEGGDPDECR